MMIADALFHIINTTMTVAAHHSPITDITMTVAANQRIPVMTTADAETGLSLEAADNTNSTALFIREQFFYKNTPTSNFTDNLNYDNIYIT